MASSSPSAEVGATVQVTQRGTRRAIITAIHGLPESGVPTLATRYVLTDMMVARYVLTDSTGATFLARRGEFTVIEAAPSKYDVLVAAIKAQEEEFKAADSYCDEGRANAYDEAAQAMRDLLKLVGEL